MRQEDIAEQIAELEHQRAVYLSEIESARRSISNYEWNVEDIGQQIEHLKGLAVKHEVVTPAPE